MRIESEEIRMAQELWKEVILKIGELYRQQVRLPELCLKILK
ncbi:MAG: hypothetical protein N2327_05940 [Caldimicrobium sp.]|nr:hypothetical protein [Caldimicrobium sp.]MCX7873952.1 hypothetical protein [Caldimicrobium sp.]MDW8094209.1 hypothetical protein [Caldimicrobium sp.]